MLLRLEGSRRSAAKLLSKDEKRRRRELKLLGGKGQVNRPQSLASKNHRLSTDQTSRTLNKFLWSVARVELGATTARILHWFSAGESTVPGIPQVFSISVISFTEM
jgi:hypothetical protein